MPILQPVVYRIGTDVVPFDLWPITQCDTGWLRLHEAMAPDEVGMAVWSLLFYSCSIGDDLPVPDTPDAALRLLSDVDYLYVWGGLLIEDPFTGVVVEPGCCSDLSEWREWLGLRHGAMINLGCYPSPELEYRGDVARIWTEDADGETPLPERTYVDLRRTDLPDLLRLAQRDLVGFLAAVREWANAIAPQQVDRLVAALDTGLEISKPLPLENSQPR